MIRGVSLPLSLGQLLHQCPASLISARCFLPNGGGTLPGPFQPPPPPASSRGDLWVLGPCSGAATVAAAVALPSFLATSVPQSVFPDPSPPSLFLTSLLRLAHLCLPQPVSFSNLSHFPSVAETNSVLFQFCLLPSGGFQCQHCDVGFPMSLQMEASNVPSRPVPSRPLPAPFTSNALLTAGVSGPSSLSHSQSSAYSRGGGGGGGCGAGHVLSCRHPVQITSSHISNSLFFLNPAAVFSTVPLFVLSTALPRTINNYFHIPSKHFVPLPSKPTNQTVQFFSFHGHSVLTRTIRILSYKNWSCNFIYVHLCSRFLIHCSPWLIGDVSSGSQNTTQSGPFWKFFRHSSSITTGYPGQS